MRPFMKPPVALTGRDAIESPRKLFLGNIIQASQGATTACTPATMGSGGDARPTILHRLHSYVIDSSVADDGGNRQTPCFTIWATWGKTEVFFFRDIKPLLPAEWWQG